MLDREKVLENVSVKLSITTGKHFSKVLEIERPREYEAILEAMQIYAEFYHAAALTDKTN